MISDALMILGPTACGKTALSIRIAKQVPAEIISVDSALVYRGMNIGTAKPDLEEMQGIPHHLIDIREPHEAYSVAEFLKDAVRLVREIRSRGKLPVLAGGTMLYANALRKGLSELPSTPDDLRAAVTAEGEKKGWPEMHRLLSISDPETASRLAPNDRQRISRATEVFRLTGKTLSELQKTMAGTAPDLKLSVLALIPENRARLHERIAERFDLMLEAGFLDEMKRLMQDPHFDPDSPAMRAVGYRQAIEYLNGRTDLKTFREKAIAATRQLAKRQITWLRSTPDKTVFDPFAENGLDEAQRWALSQNYGNFQGFPEK